MPRAEFLKDDIEFIPPGKFTIPLDKDAERTAELNLFVISLVTPAIASDLAVCADTPVIKLTGTPEVNEVNDLFIAENAAPVTPTVSSIFKESDELFSPLIESDNPPKPPIASITDAVDEVAIPMSLMTELSGVVLLTEFFITSTVLVIPEEAPAYTTPAICSGASLPVIIPAPRKADSEFCRFLITPSV